MKRLLLLRHAAAEDVSRGGTDFARELSPRGQQEARLMGQRLAKRQLTPQRILSSSARRALQTASRVAEQLGLDEKRIEAHADLYAAGTQDLLQAVQACADTEPDTLLLVAHNPSISMLSALLSGDSPAILPTCGLVCLYFEVDTWAAIEQRMGSLLLFDYPANASV